jgi:hypothetical protein
MERLPILDTLLYGHHSPFYDRRWLRYGMILLLSLLIAGCSSTQLAYRQLDWAIVWWVDDYVPLTEAQESRLEKRVTAHLAWHCSQELPRYNEWLTRLKQQTTQTPITEAQVSDLQGELFDAIDRLLVEITPTATQLLGSISGQQQADFAETLAEGQHEREQEYLEGSRKEQLQEREERTRERAETWLGELTEEQRQRIARWNTERGQQTQIWLEGRARWQQQLLRLLDRRASPEFDEKLADLIQNSSAYKGETYQTMMADSRQALTLLITDLISLSTPAQRDHLRQEIDAVQEDFSALVCNTDA